MLKLQEFKLENTTLDTFTTSFGKIKVAALTPAQYADRPDILKKYFRNNGKHLDRCHIPQITPEAYNEVVGAMTAVPQANMNYNTATDYYKQKIRKQIMAKDFGVKPNQIDTTDYFWGEQYYTCSDFWVNQERVENAYRETGADARNESMNDVYIKQDPRTACMDHDLYNSLFSLVIKAVRTRKVMLLQRIEPLCGVLNNICEYTNGFTENPTRSMMSTLSNYVRFFQNYLKNPEVQEFLKNNNDITIYGNESFRTDYVETYCKILQSIFRCTELELSELEDIMGDIEDPYGNEILQGNILSTTDYGYNRKADEDEDLEEMTSCYDIESADVTDNV